MNKALLAGIIFVSVGLVVSLEALLLSRSTARRLDEAAQADLNRSLTPWPASIPPPYTAGQKRLFFAALGLEVAMLVAAGIVAGFNVGSSTLTLALVLGAVAVQYMRIFWRMRVDKQRFASSRTG
jgi:Flp pilus assembly protein TadB